MSSSASCNSPTLVVLPRDSSLAQASTGNVFSVLTYNILADPYVRVPGQEEWNGFQHCLECDLDWDSSRAPALTAEILRKRADILCLQECHFEFRNGEWRLPAWTQALLDAGYDGIMQGLRQKDIEKNAERNLRHVGKKIPTGVATFYLRNKFNLAAQEHGQGMGSMLVLMAKDCQRKVAVCNMHLVGNPEKMDEQICQLISAIKALSKHADAAWMICGDFNNGLAKGCPLDHFLANDVQLQILSDVASDKTYCGRPGEAFLCDHIVFSGTRLCPLAKTDASLTPEEIEMGLPCMRLPVPCPSDHIAIGCVFEFLQFEETKTCEPETIGTKLKKKVSKLKTAPSASQPKYKERSFLTHKAHLQALIERRDSGSIPVVDTLLLGDSLIEHLKGGFEGYEAGWVECPEEVFNAGVGGDRVENVLWRIQSSSSTPESAPTTTVAPSNPCGLLSDPNLLNARQIVLCIGTNNFALAPPSTPVSFLEGMRTLITMCIQSQPRLERIAVMGLPCQKHLPFAALAAEYNQMLHKLCEELAAEYTSRRDHEIAVSYMPPVFLTADDYVDELHFNEKGYSKFTKELVSLTQHS